MFNWFKKDINDPLLVLLRRISEQFKQSNVTSQNILEWHQMLGVRLMNIENKLDLIIGTPSKDLDTWKDLDELANRKEIFMAQKLRKAKKTRKAKRKATAG